MTLDVLFWALLCSYAIHILDETLMNGRLRALDQQQLLAGQ